MKAVMLAALVVLAVAVVAVVTSYRRDLGRADALARGGGRIAPTMVGPIEYAERGVGVPVLSIHGAGGGYDQGLVNAGELFGDDFRIIAPSRFGYLATPLPVDRSVAAQADAHAALLSALNVERAIVFGVSAGTRSALELAIRHPERVSTLILVVPATYAPTSPVAVEGSRASAFVLWLVNAGADFVWWALEKIAPSVLVRFIGVPPQVVAAASPEEQERVMRMVRSIEPLSLRFPGINVDSAPEPDIPAFERVTAPTLVVSAKDDLFNTLPAAEFAAGRIRGAQLVVYRSGGHLLVGHQAELRRTIDEFLVRNAIAGRDLAAPALR